MTLLSASAGNLPSGIRCARFEPEDFRAVLRPGQRVILARNALEVPEARVTVDLTDASRWCAALPVAGVDPDAEGTLGLLVELRRMLRDEAPEGGLVPLLLRSGAPSSTLERALHNRLLRALPALRVAFLAGDTALAEQALKQLVGLGSGLTPSGDDFIVGYLAALHSRRPAQLGPDWLANGLSARVASLATHTHLISRQFILDALGGCVSESFGEVLRALSRRDPVSFRAAASDIAAMGQSSGADSLVGLLFGFRPELVLAQMSDVRGEVARLPS
jgi:Protein of unknown function (DUF2877)